MNNKYLLIWIFLDNIINERLLIKSQNTNNNYQCLTLTDHKISNKKLKICLAISHILLFLLNLFNISSFFN